MGACCEVLNTLLLRAIAGFESPLMGEIWINGVLVNAKSNPIPTERRKVGMVFQDFALFPHLNILKKTSPLASGG